VQLMTVVEGGQGTAQDTLAIQISDDLGTRDYEMYSGGEAFRVDFALRIALAKLLAERSGASLPTLIIDEGFGTQDEEGIQRLVETLGLIKDEFQLILVVTHLDRLKSEFERRIDVTKDPIRGSMARVV
ncbi:MAG: SbcC/MukB-like Walker B domain-containing protein, partial [Dehalococcoidia bacterium]